MTTPTPIIITMPGDVVPKARARTVHFKSGHSHTYTPEKAATYQHDLGWTAREAMDGRRPLRGPVKIQIDIAVRRPKRQARHFPTGRPDLDNCVKIALDALNKIVINDDAQVVVLSAAKFYAAHASIEITVEAIPEPGAAL
mgnify:CR=1 FL=1